MVLYHKFLKIEETKTVDSYLTLLELGVADQYSIVSHKPIYKIMRVDPASKKRYVMSKRLYEEDEMLHLLAYNRQIIYDPKEIDFRGYLDEFYGGHAKFYKIHEEKTIIVSTVEVKIESIESVVHSTFDELFKKAIADNLIQVKDDNDRQNKYFKLNYGFIEWIEKIYDVSILKGTHEYFTNKNFKLFLEHEAEKRKNKAWDTVIFYLKIVGVAATIYGIWKGLTS